MTAIITNNRYAAIKDCFTNKLTNLGVWILKVAQTQTQTQTQTYQTLSLRQCCLYS